MASAQDETEDSRTSVGRKRDISALIPEQDPLLSSEEEEIQRSHKRMRKDSDIGNSLSNEIETEMSLETPSASVGQKTSPSGVPSGYRTSVPSVESSNDTQASKTISWNKGVQGGLRTSFGSKAQRTLPSTHIARAEASKTEVGIREATHNGDIEMSDHQDPVQEEAPALPFTTGLDKIEGPSRSSSSLHEIFQIHDSDDDSEDSFKLPSEDAPGQAAKAGSASHGWDSLIESARNSLQKNPATKLPKKLESPAAVYPRDASQFVASIVVNGVTAQLPEMLDGDKHINLFDIKYKTFKKHFTAKNPSLRKGNGKKKLEASEYKQPFNKYVYLYYGHYLEGREKNSVGGMAVKPVKLELRSAQKELTPTLGTGLSNNEALPAFTPINPPQKGSQTSPIEGSLTMENSHFTGQSYPDPGYGDLDMKDSMHDGSIQEHAAVNAAIVLTESELMLQARYFPPVAGEPFLARCLACGDSGHKADRCPGLLCQLCNGSGHSSLICPQNQRCGKCRQKGHSLNDCKEKLAASKGERGSCDFCGSPGHVEDDCQLVWRSFAPKPNDIKTVSGIPVHCYTCGTINHYGPECGLRNVKKVFISSSTWSESNLSKYLDSKSKSRAISAGIDFRPGKVFNIKGKANDPINLDESDEDEPFIRAKVNNGAGKRGGSRNGHIRFEQPRNDAPATFPARNPDPRSRGPPRHAPIQSSYEPESYRQPQGDQGRSRRERTFSPPPPMHFNDDRYAPQLPYRNGYRPNNPHSQGPGPTYPFTVRPELETHVTGRHARGHKPKRGGKAAGRGGGNVGADSTAPKESNKKKPKVKKAKKAKATKS